MDTFNTDALHDATRDAGEARWRAYDALNQPSPTPYNERYIAWREASARHDALIDAGLILTLGPLGEEPPHDRQDAR